MPHTHRLVYRIDAEDRIRDMGRAALEGSHPGGPARYIGRVLWEFLQDRATVEIYRHLVRAARQGRFVRFRYRCDAPNARRLFSMAIHRTEDGLVEFATELLREEARPAVALLDPAIGPRSSEFQRVCSWCERAALPDGRWVRIEEAVETLGLLQREALPQLTHGICERCAKRIMRQTVPCADDGAGQSAAAGH